MLLLHCKCWVNAPPRRACHKTDFARGCGLPARARGSGLCRFRRWPLARNLTERARGKQGIVSQLTDRFDAAQIAKLDGVRIIANVAVGYDNIDVEAATRRGILVTNTPDVLTEYYCRLAFALMLAAARRIVEGHLFVHSGNWRRWTIDLLAGHDIHHKTLGIFGMGRIGQAVARRGRGFSMRLLYHDTRRAPEEIERELGLEFASKEQLLAEADFVSLHVPLVESTRHISARPNWAEMKNRPSW